MLLRSTSKFAQWSFYSMLNSKQRNFIKNIISNKQKRLIRSLLVRGHSEWSQVDELKHRLYSQGFSKKAYDDLNLLLTKAKDMFQKKQIAWILAQWHANHYSKEDAKHCLHYLKIATEGEKDQLQLRSIAIIEAESYELLGDVETAKMILTRVIKDDPHPDLYLAYANLEASLTKRTAWINRALEHFQLSPISFIHSETETVYDRLHSKKEKFTQKEALPKVSVLIPTYNDEERIKTALNSILSQTWENLEVLVVDDCSTDGTIQVVEQYSKKDVRVKLIKAEKNGGAYVARNLALKEATGEFVTINDSDDWSHPEKIEKQVLNLMHNPTVIGNTSQQARATNDVKFYRRGKPGLYIFSNISSFMFRRHPVFEKIGYWDSVRFGADVEFIKRIKKVFGEKAVIDLETGPLSLQRQSPTSLTGNSAFGYQGFFMGARKEYVESHETFHETRNDLRYEFPQQIRPFPVPEPMRPIKEAKINGRRKFDVVIVSDFRDHSGPVDLIVEEIQKQKQHAARIGFIQLYQYDLNSHRDMSVKIRELIDGRQIQMLVYGEKIATDHLLLLHPPVLQEEQKYVPDVVASKVTVIINVIPLTNETIRSPQSDFVHCQDRLKAYFGKQPMWVPLNTEIRQALLEHYRGELPVQISSENWK
ncbi:hypothetical protein BKP37_16520 [Anaerobacillus alkalilacustris]|uniref:Glycosyltransferase 2-like domain-containing protein n=1 Tax=Anaerobacillus alkalilacustris TaxID=393763 RepID=A0A1S2LFK7_9BACI|nr:hypothetical protein BKP37_16520 [Anaerobacillus alkalilacustris]